MSQSSTMLFATLSLSLALSSSHVAAIAPAQSTSGGFLVSVTTPWNGPTPAPSTSLHCTSGSTVLHTQDCTYGFPISYCYSSPPTPNCSTGYYPSVYYPERCFSESTCFPVPTTTSACNQGNTAYSTHTNYNGTLAGGKHTVIEEPVCRCSGWISWQQTSPYSSACLPTYKPSDTPCASYFTTSATTFSYTNISDVVTVKNTFCYCPAGETPYYPVATGTAKCAKVTSTRVVITVQTSRRTLTN